MVQSAKCASFIMCFVILVLDVVVCRQLGRSGLYAAVAGAHASEARGRNLSKPSLGQYVNLV